MEPFKLGINMAGAVSAGAYTAGVLDFLTEALDEWYKAKEEGAPVLPHEVSIAVFTGASAGGMCAAISAAMLQEEFEYIHDVSRAGTTNKLYEAWVNRIDIRELLKTGDFETGSIVSLLDSTIIDTIAREALTPGAPKRRKYVSPNLTLFLTVTNLRGVPYALFQGPERTPDEYVTYHADRMRFEMVDAGAKTVSPDARPLVRGADGEMWSVLRSAAMATGAFPMFLAPRVLHRDQSEYARPPWKPADLSVLPAFPKGQCDPWTTVNIDGGVTNNSPFALAQEYLATLDPLNRENTADAEWVDRAVLTIAPFPGNEDWNKNYDPSKQSTLFAVLSGLVNTLISQSRFFGESLSTVTGRPAFSRFFIAPSDHRRKGKPPLQCGLLSAFGGFFCRGFRAHDFQLGRRNCQAFLDKSFVLPESNPLFAAASDAIRERFKRKPPMDNVGLPNERWIPIIPLCGAAKEPVPYPATAQLEKDSLDRIVNLIARRIKALLLLVPLKSKLLRFAIRIGVSVMLTFGVKREMKARIADSLGDSLRL